LITDYCCSEGKHTEQFKAYLKSQGYVILTPSDYCKVRLYIFNIASSICRD